jgi:hypothetical protein
MPEYGEISEGGSAFPSVPAGGSTLFIAARIWRPAGGVAPRYFAWRSGITGTVRTVIKKADPKEVEADADVEHDLRRRWT